MPTFEGPKRSTETSLDAAREREATLERRANTLLVCPDNDAESRMILLLAEKMGMATLRSEQQHGAKLDKEDHLLERVAAAKKGEVWIVEMPGPELEGQLKEDHETVHVIDHHTYGALDRATDAETGKRKSSSLEQFLAEAGITDEELRSWGYDPKTVRGLGIFDDRFAQGLRDASYSQKEINDVLDLSAAFVNERNPVFAEIRDAAADAWEHREDWHGYLLIRSDFPKDIRGAIAHRSIRDGLDTHPFIISSRGGQRIFVQNVDPPVIDLLKRKIPPENTFTFGASRCWGYSSNDDRPTVTLEDVLSILAEAPAPETPEVSS